MNIVSLIPSQVRRHFFASAKGSTRVGVTVIVVTGFLVATGTASSQFSLDSAANLPPVSSGSAAWGDYDNDGRLDLLLTGADAMTGLPSLSLWHDATNYCWLLTQRELAAGRIPLGSHYRLPIEAEWECAAWR